MMPGGSKRSGPPEDSSSSRTRQRLNPSSSPDTRLSNFKSAIGSLLVLLCLFTSAAATHHAPRTRAPIYEPHRGTWAEVREDLRRRKAFRRTVRMSEESFEKLANLVRPALQKDERFGRLRCAKYGVIEVEIRLAIGLRMLAGGSYLDVASRFGISHSMVYTILWQVIDAINNSPQVGQFFFPQTEEECRLFADGFEAKSTNGIFDHVVSATDGLFVKMKAPAAKCTSNTLSYYSGSKTGFGFNVQATCNANYRFSNISIIAPGAANDWSAWNRSALAEATMRLPKGYHIIGDAAYPISEKLLTPYPGKSLPKDQDSFNFHLSQLRVKIEQSFGILVSTWGILWKPLSMSFSGRPDVIVAVFHLHNFCRDEQTPLVVAEEEDTETGKGRVQLAPGGFLPRSYRSVVEPTGSTAAKPTRSGDTPTRAALAAVLMYNRQFRPTENLLRNA